MPSSTLELDYLCDGRMFVPPFFEPNFRLNEQVEWDQETFVYQPSLSFSGMMKAPANVSDVVVNRLKEIDHVKAILMGRSGEVYHVWSLIDDWTPKGRKAVYEAQRELLRQLSGFELDFYVVPLEGSIRPENLVSDIPTVFERGA